MAIEWNAQGTLGLFKDPHPDSIPPNAWSDANNVRFKNGRTEKRSGQQEALFTFSVAQADPSPNNTGGGTLGSVATHPTSVAEIITLTCTKDASSSPVAVAGSEEFSVTGSVSGAIGTATVGVSFASPEVSFLLSRDIASPMVDFVVGDNFTLTLTKVAPSININHLIPWSTQTAYYWIYASLTNIYRWDGSTHTDITRSPTTSPIGVYTADADTQWTSSILGEVVFMNNGKDLPQYIGTSGSDFADIPTDTVSPDPGNWPNALRCKSLRAFKQYLIAMNLTEGATFEPQNLRWSTAADPGSLPLWDIADPTLEAGETTLSETDGELVDGLSMGDTFIIYKEDSVWGMQLIGGQFVMRFYKIFGDGGLLTQNCVAQFDGKHFAVGPSDVYIHNGSSKNSVITNKIRNTLFQQIDDTYVDRSFVVADRRNRECLFCFVEANSGATYPNKALVYNWESNEISFRSLPGSGYIGFGQVTDPIVSDTWDSDSGSWDNDFTEWGAVEGKPTENRMVIPDTTGQTFYAEGLIETDGGTAFRAYAERLGIDGGSKEGIKHVYRMYPRIQGTSGGTIKCYVGGELNEGTGYEWSGPHDYVIGSTTPLDQVIDVSQVYGRRLGVRFESEGNLQWSVSGYRLEGQLSGNL